MDFFSVLDSILEEFGLFELAAAMIGVGGVYFFAFRRCLRSVFDPLTYVVFFSAVTTILLVVLRSIEVVSIGKLTFSILALFLYYGAFLAVAARAPRHRSRQYAERRPPRAATLVVLLIANATLLGVTYAFFGVPLFLESRLSQFAGGGGFGVIARLTGGLEFASVLLGFIALRGGGSARPWGLALVVQFLIAAVLSGSKGAVLGAVFAWYLAQVYAIGSWRVPFKMSPLIVASLGAILALPLLTIVVQGGGLASDLRSAGLVYATRVAAEGDGYVYFFGGDLIDSIARHDLLALVRPILTGLRLAPVETAVNPGFEVMSEIFSIDGPSAGPNSRLAIYLLYFYGVGGIVLAPVLGVILGVARNGLLSASAPSPFRYVVVAAVYLNCTRFEVDPQITMNAIFNLVLALPIIWLAFAAGKPRRRGVNVPVAQPRAAA